MRGHTWPPNEQSVHTNVTLFGLSDWHLPVSQICRDAILIRLPRWEHTHIDPMPVPLYWSFYSPTLLVSARESLWMSTIWTQIKLSWIIWTVSNWATASKQGISLVLLFLTKTIFFNQSTLNHFEIYYFTCYSVRITSSYDGNGIGCQHLSSRFRMMSSLLALACVVSVSDLTSNKLGD